MFASVHINSKNIIIIIIIIVVVVGVIFFITLFLLYFEEGENHKWDGIEFLFCDTWKFMN